MDMTLTAPGCPVAGEMPGWVENAVNSGSGVGDVRVRIFGTAPGKGAIVSFELDGAHAHDVATILDRYGVAVRAGTHCAQPLLQRFGVTSTCRASMGLSNTREEIDRLAEALQKAHDFLA